jgi:hypothetical protein
MSALSKEEVVHIFTHQLPQILDEHPELEPQLYHFFLKAFARKEEVAALRQDIFEFREETREEFKLVRSEVKEQFGQVDKQFRHVDDKFEALRAEMHDGFHEVYKRVDQLGARWGIRSESIHSRRAQALRDAGFEVVEPED